MVEQEKYGVRHERQESPPRPFPGSDQGPDERDRGRQCEERSGAPEDDVCNREKDRASGPLERGRKTGDSRRELGQPLDVRQIARIQTEGEEPRAGERVRQAETQRDRRSRQAEAEEARHPADPGAEALLFSRRVRSKSPDQDSEPDRHEERERSHLAGDREAERESGQDGFRRAGTTLRETDRAQEGRRRENRQERVDRPEVRELEAEGAESQKRRRPEGHPTVLREAPGEKVGEPHRGQIREGGERPADDVSAVVTGLSDRVGDHFGHEDRQGSVHERVVPAVVRVER